MLVFFTSIVHSETCGSITAELMLYPGHMHNEDPLYISSYVSILYASTLLVQHCYCLTFPQVCLR